MLSTDIPDHFPSCTNHDLAIDCLATDNPIPNHQVNGRWIEIVLGFVCFSIVAVLAILPVAVPLVGYGQLEQLADWLPNQVALQIAALMAGVAQQAYDAVVDKVAEAVVVPMTHVLVPVLLTLPQDQVVQHALVADVVELL